MCMWLLALVTGDMWNMTGDRWHTRGNMWFFSYFFLFFLISFGFFRYWCYYPHTLKDWVSPVWGILSLYYFIADTHWASVSFNVTEIYKTFLVPNFLCLGCCNLLSILVISSCLVHLPHCCPTFSSRSLACVSVFVQFCGRKTGPLLQPSPLRIRFKLLN